MDIAGKGFPEWTTFLRPRFQPAVHHSAARQVADGTWRGWLGK